MLISRSPSCALKSASWRPVSVWRGKRITPCLPSAASTPSSSRFSNGRARSSPSIFAPSASPVGMIFISCIVPRGYERISRYPSCSAGGLVHHQRAGALLLSCANLTASATSHAGACVGSRRRLGSWRPPRRTAKGQVMTADQALAKLKDLLPDLEALYTDVHSHPELSMQETRTAGLAADQLRASGYEVTTGVGKTGVVGLLKNGAGPTVMLRADMDALPVE